MRWGVLLCGLFLLACGGAEDNATAPSSSPDARATDTAVPSDGEVLNPPPADTQEPLDTLASDSGSEVSADSGTEVSQDTLSPVEDGATDTEATPEKVILELPAAQSEGYIAGGLLARYYAGGAPSPDELPDAPFLFRLEPALDLSVSSPDFAALNAGKAFTAHYSGGLQVTEAGVYELAVTANDGVRLQLAGVTVLTFWDQGETVTQSVWVALEAGWYPLDVVYKRLNWDAHLQLWWGPEGSLLSPIPADALGYVATVPAALPPLSGTAEVLSTGLLQASLAVSASAPSSLSIQAVSPGKPEGLFSVSTPIAATEQVVPLGAGSTWTITVTLEDLWGRTAVLPPLEVVTGTVPNFTPGGLLATVYQGGDYKNFETVAATRVDPVINHPGSLDGNANGSFLLPIAGDDFSIRWEGGLYVETTGDYILYLGADDGQRLYVDGVLVAELWSDHGMLYAPAPLTLAAGWHTLEAHMYENGGQAGANLEWESDTMARQVIAAEHLGYVPPADNGQSPVVTDITASNEAAGQIKVELWTSELCTGTLTVSQAGETQTITLLGPADAFQWWGSDFEAGLVSIEATLTDAAGNVVTADPITITVP